MLTVMAPLLSATGLILYFLVSTRFGIYWRYPWQFLVIAAAGAALGLYRLYRAPGAGTGIGAALSLGIAGFVFWYLFSFSMFGPREDRPRVGERFPEFTLAGSDGSKFSLVEARGQRLLIICYRGDW